MPEWTKCLPEYQTECTYKCKYLHLAKIVGAESIVPFIIHNKLQSEFVDWQPRVFNNNLTSIVGMPVYVRHVKQRNQLCKLISLTCFPPTLPLAVGQLLLILTWYFNSKLSKDKSHPICWPPYEDTHQIYREEQTQSKTKLHAPHTLRFSGAYPSGSPVFDTFWRNWS